jgi:hypothetical protein
MHLLVTMKNMALYPVTNKTNIESVSSLHLWLTEYLSHHSPLVLEITKDQLLNDEGTPVYQEKPTEQLLAAPLFRDGVQTIIFEEGLAEQELRNFLNILLKFRNPAEVDQDDIVAVLWEASFTNIRYTISSEYEQVGSEFEISALKVAKNGQVFRDIDAPWNEEDALSPMGVDGDSPVSKPIASLFALAKSDVFSSTTTSDFENGYHSETSDPSFGNASDSQASDQFGLVRTEVDFSGNVGASNGVFDEDSGFGPFESSFDDGYSDNRYSDDGPLRGGSPSAEGDLAGAGPSRTRPSGAGQSEANDFDSDSLSSAYEQSNAGQSDDADQSNAGQADDEDEESLDIDLGSVAEAFKDMETAEGKPSPQANANPLTLEMLKDRPQSCGPELEERLKHWGLSSREIKQVSALLKWEEGRNYSFDALEIMTVLLSSPILTSEHIHPMLVFLTNELKNSIKRCDMKFFNNFYLSLRNNAQQGLHYHAIIYNELESRLQAQDILNLIWEPGPSDEALIAGYEDLRYFLYQIPPIGVNLLISSLPKIANHKLWALIIEVIAYSLLRAGSQTTALVVQKLNDKALVQLIFFIKTSFQILPQQFIMSLTKHRSAAVRETMARALLENSPENFHSMCAHMILDNDPTVLRLVRPALSKKRNASVEGHLSTFLKQSYDAERHSENRQLIDTYRVYGKCASQQALPFLEKVLLKKDFKTFISRTTDSHKTGAALALFYMPKEIGAAEVLIKASQSSFKNVRLAYLEAKKIYDEDKK